MPSLIHLRRRIKSAKNIAQITKAMEMVSASKMKKAQEQALSSRPFAQKLESLIAHISATPDPRQHPLLRRPSSAKQTLLVLISTNKGLCGSLNVNLLRHVNNWIKLNHLTHLTTVHVHKKAKSPLLPNQQPAPVSAVFHNLGETITFAESRALARFIIDSFVTKQCDSVFVAYSRFINTLQSEPIVQQLLPFTPADAASPPRSSPYVFEPSSSSLLAQLLPYQIEISLYQILVEALASEHSARMVAMKSASENARELISNLTLDYNQARQTAVTNELLDATTAKMALN